MLFPCSNQYHQDIMKAINLRIGLFQNVELFATSRIFSEEVAFYYLKTIIMKQELKAQLEQNMPKSYLSLWNDIQDFLEWKLTAEDVKKEVNRLLIEMEISTNNASSYEIALVERETKYMLKVLGITV